MHRVLIIGLGLIGGSFAKALRHYKIANEIWAYDIDLEAIELAKSEKIIEGYSEINDKFDLIVIASPLASYAKIIEEISKESSPSSVSIDLGSVKEFAIKLAAKNLKDRFIACHPIAGSDKSGFEHADAKLFFEKKFLICSKNKSTEIVEKIIKKIGAKCEFIEAKQHDEIYALISHLPQFLSFLTKEFSPKNISDESLKTAFRLDNSSPEIWSDIFKFNEKNLEKFYIEFFDHLNNFVEDLNEKKFDKLAGSLILNDSHKVEELNAEIIFRLIIVASYLKITKISDYQSFAGSGFKDFTSIISIINKENLLKNLPNLQKEISQMFEKLLK